jgi:hypothetical protein
MLCGAAAGRVKVVIVYDRQLAAQVQPVVAGGSFIFPTCPVCPAAKRMKSMTLLNAQKPGASGPGSMKDGSGPDPSGGLTIDDLAIDDVHYQMMMWNAFALAW